MARFKSIKFALSSTIPMDSLTGKEKDRYANIKPFTEVIVEFDATDDVDLKSKAAKTIIEDAFTHATNMAFNQQSDFRKELRAMFGEKPTTDRR